jgi:pimeloyl-ACP methyl ester carboxylesterase
VGYVRFSRRPAGGAPDGDPLGSARLRPVRTPRSVLGGPLRRRPGCDLRPENKGRPVRALLGGDATPWFGINHDCYREIWSELERTWPEDELIAQCRGLEVPVLIIDGEQDLRPRWAVDSLERALPRVTRVILPDAGHIPWLEEPEEFTRPLLAFLEQAIHP